MNNYNKEERLKLIEEFLKRREVKRQEELVSLLKRRGFKVTQA
ncbi:MAG TPA: arginine repressor, partial [Firmicutes bacterium]|nr:arginine repressor [Bacillota bacterium]